MLVLVADDDRAVREALERALQLHGYEVALASDGDTALTAVDARTPDALVLDVMMPGLDGLDVTRRLRRQGNRIPILLLTARDAVGDRVEGLDAGADDYLPKPYDLEELLARLRALLRRSKPEEPGAVLRFADLTLDLGSMDARRGGRRFELTTTEAHLLELFMRNPRQVLPRSLIYERVWGYDFSHSSNALDVYVGYLRRKTEAEDEPRLIHTVRGTGLRPARAVTLRARLTLVAAGVVAVVVALACATTYFVMRHELQAQLDGSLANTAQRCRPTGTSASPGITAATSSRWSTLEGNRRRRRRSASAADRPAGAGRRRGPATSPRLLPRHHASRDRSCASHVAPARATYVARRSWTRRSRRAAAWSATTARSSDCRLDPHPRLARRDRRRGCRRRASSRARRSLRCAA